MKRSPEERAKIIDPGFSVADADLPSISTSDEGLIIRFRDWREDSIEALFIDAVSFRWDEIDWDLVEGERFDSVHVIDNSEWMTEHLAQNSFASDDGFKHYRLNFNAGGTLEVIARCIQTRTEQVAPPNRSAASSLNSESTVRGSEG